MSQSLLNGRIQERIWAEFVDASIPQVMEEVLEVVKRTPQEQSQKQIVDMTVPHQFMSRVQDVCVSAQRHVFDGERKPPRPRPPLRLPSQVV